MKSLYGKPRFTNVFSDVLIERQLEATEQWV